MLEVWSDEEERFDILGMATFVIKEDGERQDIAFEEVQRGDQNKWCRLAHEEEDVDDVKGRKPTLNEGERTRKISWKVKHTINGGGVGMPQLSMQEFVWPTKD